MFLMFLIEVGKQLVLYLNSHRLPWSFYLRSFATILWRLNMDQVDSVHE